MKILSEPSRSLKEYRLLTRFTAKDVVTNVSLKTKLCNTLIRKAISS